MGCDGDMIVQNGLVFNNGGFRLSFSLSRRGARFILFYFFYHVDFGLGLLQWSIIIIFYFDG